MSAASTRRLALLVALIAAITALHYLTTVQKGAYHDLYRRLYYIPIVLSGLWFGLRGGILAGASVSLLFMPHVVVQWGHHPQTHPDQYLEILLYNVIGAMTGFLAGRAERQRRRAEETARQLEESYARLRRQADQILEIEEQLRRADRLAALGELSAGIAHEIRNPLGSIRGTAEILQEAFAPTDQRYEFAQILVREVDRLNRVLQDVLTFARPAAPEESRFALAGLVDEVLALTELAARKATVAVACDIPADWELCGHREQLKQALLNLVLNALQAMPQGGRLSLATQRDERELILSVSDTGAGIPAALHSRIFNPFFTTRAEGTGLGLAITHRIVAGHGGRIELDSTPGTGTTFRLRLPHRQECPGRHDP